MRGKKEIKKIARQVSHCKKCSLWKTRKNTVAGEGPANAKIIIIGQAPGRTEDEKGRPFIGRAGKLLNQLLGLAGLKREKVFITSPLKCFPTPPPNRKPTKKEIEACLPYLKRQIEVIRPKKIILLGQTPFSLFFPKRKLKDFRGKAIVENSKKYFISYHPAAGIRFLKNKKILEKDFRRFKKFLKAS